MKTLRVLLPIFLCAASTLHAQLVNDGATATLANVTNNITDTVTVGTNGSFTLLTLADNALLINSAHGVIGRNSTAKSNEVHLVSPTARWRMGGDLSVGSNGASSRLVVSNGATVVANVDGFLGRQPGASNNVALVTGVGSGWTSDGLYVGYQEGRNQLVVSNGAVVSDRIGLLGYFSIANNNAAVVTGAGSVWSNRLNLIVGLDGAGNRLNVSNGAAVVADVDGFFGYNPGASNNVALVTGAGSGWTSDGLLVGYQEGRNQLVVSNGGLVVNRIGHLGYFSIANNNLAVVTGAGSVWSNRLNLNVGFDGSGNRLDVSNGGAVSAGNVFVGFTSLSANNRVTVNGGTLRATNAAGTGVLDVRRGTNQFLSGLIDTDRLVLTNAAGKFEFLGGTLITRSALNTVSPMSVGQPGGGSAFWDVRPGLVNHFVADSVLIGNASSSNQLLVSSGARLTNSGFGNIGSGAGADGNGATVTGPGSRWEMPNGLRLGNGGAFNRLTVDGGGWVASFAGRIGLSGTTSSDNFALVTGIGSVWSNSSTLFVGETASGNQLQVDGGGLVVSDSGSVGQSATSSGNIATLTGNGSEWRLGSDLEVGDSGSFNQLLISGGAVVQDNNGILAASAASGNNTALVSGPGSTWSNRVDTIVGWFGPNNQLLVNNGGRVVNAAGGTIGSQASAPGNVATVTGSGSVWNNGGGLTVGYEAANNRLAIEAGARVDCESGILGYSTGGNNLALVSGSGSLWSNRANVIVGFSGAGNQLLVTNGGRVINVAGGTIGSQVSAPGNVATVTGNGSVWNSGSGLSVGNLAANNRLVIEAGGRVDCDRGVVGFGSGNNNLALVTGAGSLWSNVSLQIGGFGPNNQLIVSNGATVVAAVDGFLGHDPGASNNVAMVTGVGSLWTTSDGLLIGYQEGRNQLVVSNGGVVVNGIGHLGYFSIANNNVAVVTGAGSVWSNRLSLNVGFDGSGNRLVVNNGGRVVTGNGSIGFAPTANGNTVVLADAGSIWTNLASLIVGESGSGNALIAGNGATVASSNLIVGLNSASTNNRVTVNGGTLRAASPAGTGVLDVRRGTNVLNAGLVDVDRLVVTNKGAIPLIGEFGNGGTNTLNPSSKASPYPSTIGVTSLEGTITKVTVTLSNLTCADDSVALRILLVGPGGQNVMLLNGAGGFNPVSNVKLTFDDGAATLLPEGSPIVSGTYRPTHYLPGAGMPSPAPAGPYSTNLSVFNGSDPNGVWSLYIMSGLPDNVGNLRGWSIRIETDAPFVDSSTFELNGGTLVTRGALINNDRPFIVGGPGGVPAIWEARAGLTDNFVARALLVGSSSSFNQLVISSGVLVANTNVIVGASPASSNNLLHVTGGTLRVLNPNTVLDVRGGTNRLDAGLVDVLHLVVTNTRGQFEFNGGTLRTPDTIIANGRVFIVGGGASLATLQLLGGTHLFSNNLTVATNGSLIGTGIIDGTVTVSPGGRLTPGAPIGSLDVLGTVILQGTVNLQIDKSGGVRTSDLVTASGAIFYGGSLNVTDIGTDLLAAGDRFFLFDATPYVGNFSTLNLPPLGPGLSWQNNLSSDGSIEVVTLPAGQPGFAGISRFGTNVVFTGTNGTPNASYTVLAATNVALPSSNWVGIATRLFDASGGFSFTNAIDPGIPQRFFRLRTP